MKLLLIFLMATVLGQPLAEACPFHGGGVATWGGSDAAWLPEYEGQREGAKEKVQDSKLKQDASVPALERSPKKAIYPPATTKQKYP